VIGLSTWFNFRQSGLAHAPRRVPRLPELPMVCVHRQSGHLDASEIYVPHPWRRTWAREAASHPCRKPPWPLTSSLRRAASCARCSAEPSISHNFRRVQVSILVGCAATPPLVDALIRKERWRVLALASAMLLPYLSSSLDPRLRQRYFFEFQLQRLRKEEAHARPSPLPAPVLHTDTLPGHLRSSRRPPRENARRSRGRARTRRALSRRAAPSAAAPPERGRSVGAIRRSCEHTERDVFLVA